MIKYAGIGARETPEDICRKMSQASKAMAELGFCLRSGGAKGADSAFEDGVLQSNAWKEWAAKQHNDAANAADDPFRKIYLPFKGFNRHRGSIIGSTKEARLIAKDFHPKWQILSHRGRDFHARNVYQMLGRSLNDLSRFVLCWTEDGKIQGGTGQALRIAEAFSVPILNFAIHSDDYISDFILNIGKELG